MGLLIYIYVSFHIANKPSFPALLFMLCWNLGTVAELVPVPQRTQALTDLGVVCVREEGLGEDTATISKAFSALNFCNAQHITKQTTREAKWWDTPVATTMQVWFKQRAEPQSGMISFDFAGCKWLPLLEARYCYSYPTDLSNFNAYFHSIKNCSSGRPKNLWQI